MNKLRVLIIDDEVDITNEIAEFIVGLGHQVSISNLPSDAFRRLKKEVFDLVILDIKLPEMDGIEVLKKIKSQYPEIEVIMITGHGDMNTVIQSLRLGALDYLNKPFGAFEIQSSIERSKRFITLSSNYHRVKSKYEAAHKEINEKFGHKIIGKSNAIKNIISLMAKVSETHDTPVLITGESGTGKELVARGIHNLSKRKNNYFYDVNCSAIPEHLFESELFGHTKGAFTGAINDKPGWFEIANNGTLFLDEISDMPLNQQIKLLRVIEQKKIRRVGSIKEIEVDVRIIAATNQNLDELVSEKKFRLDLFHRLNTFSINIPPLRERKDDIPLLLDYFVKHLSQKMRKKIDRYDKRIIDHLYHYEFPGNVRELKNMIEKAIIVANTDRIERKHFSLNKQKTLPEESFDLQELEKNAIQKVLGFSKLKKHAAKTLNISPQSLQRRIKKYNLE